MGRKVSVRAEKVEGGRGGGEGHIVPLLAESEECENKILMMIINNLFFIYIDIQWECKNRTCFTHLY